MGNNALNTTTQSAFAGQGKKNQLNALKTSVPNRTQNFTGEAAAQARQTKMGKDIEQGNDFKKKAPLVMNIGRKIIKY